jgi:hypothetical protein
MARSRHPRADTSGPEAGCAPRRPHARSVTATTVVGRSGSPAFAWLPLLPLRWSTLDRSAWRERLALCELLPDGDVRTRGGSSDMMSAPLMQFTGPPALAWRLHPAPNSDVYRCGLCVRFEPKLFDVPDKVWRHYIQRENRHQVVCLRCWRRLTEAIDGGTFQARHGGPLPFWSDEWRVRRGIPPEEPSPHTAAMLRRTTIQPQTAEARGDRHDTQHDARQ